MVKMMSHVSRENIHVPYIWRH